MKKAYQHPEITVYNEDILTVDYTFLTLSGGDYIEEGGDVDENGTVIPD